MDEVNISSKFVTGLIGKVITRAIKKKYGEYFADITIKSINLTVDSNTLHVHAEVDGCAKKELLTALLGFRDKEEAK